FPSRRFRVFKAFLALGTSQLPLRPTGFPLDALSPPSLASPTVALALLTRRRCPFPNENLPHHRGTQGNPQDRRPHERARAHPLRHVEGGFSPEAPQGTGSRI